MRAFIGLGSNLGDRIANLRRAVDALERDGAVDVVAVSSAYETEPVGGPSQPDYLNAVAEISTTLTPRALLERCLGIEDALGRDRATEERWGPRVVDLDVLLIEDVTVDEPDLIVPHPRMAERAFVLVPLAEIAPEETIPGRGPVRSIRDRLLVTHAVRRVGALR